MKKAVFVIPYVVLASAILCCGTARAESNLESNSESKQGTKGPFLATMTAPRVEQRAISWYITESGYVAALDEELLDQAIYWASLGNRAQFDKLIASSRLVFPLRGGLRVHVEKFSFSGKVRIKPEGSPISVWTIQEAIRKERL